MNDIIVSPETYTDLGSTWDIIVSGTFWVSDPEDLKFFNGFKSLLFYDRANGTGNFYFHYPFDSIPSVPLEGYVSSGSVLPGETVSFYVNSRVGAYTIKIYRQDQSADGVLMTTLENIQQFPQPFPVGQLAFRDGPAWPPVADFVIPRDWPSALYLARVETPSLFPVPVSAEGEASSSSCDEGPALYDGNSVRGTRTGSGESVKNSCFHRRHHILGLQLLGWSRPLRHERAEFSNVYFTRLW